PADAGQDTRLSIPTQRWLLPPLAVSVIAVAASLALHVPAYVGLGVLKDIILSDAAPEAPSPPLEIEIVERRPGRTDPAAIAPSEPVQDDEAPPPEAQPRQEEREPVARARPEPEPEPEPQVVPAPAPPVAQPEPRRATSVAQRSQDPSVPP